MRSVLLVSTLLISPSLAIADGMQCALPPEATAPPTHLAAVTAPSSPPLALAIPVPTVPKPEKPPAPKTLGPIVALPIETATPAPPGHPDALPLPIPASEIAQSPALRRIASNGAELLDLGMRHGVRGVFARKGERFQVFYVAPDGQAAIAGLMWSAAGKNLTRDQVEPIDGAIPTITIGDVSGAPAAPAGTLDLLPPPPPIADHPVARQVIEGDRLAPATRPTLSVVKTMDATAYGTSGRPDAPKLYVFIDPLCSFSIRAMAELQPYVASGRVQLAVIPVPILDYEDQGRSTLATKALLSLPTDGMVDAWRHNQLRGAPDAAPDAAPNAAADAKVAVNLAAFEAIGAQGTPTLVWRKADGTEGQTQGLPGNLDAFIASLGREP